MAGISNPAEQVHVAELYAPFSNTDYPAIDADGLSKPGGSSRCCAKGSSNWAAGCR
jgi:acetyl-CoA C-acetyltransferase